MTISLIVAMDERGGIGLNNQIPWHLPSDLRRFKALTMGHYLIVGRKTYESIGRPLPGRSIIIVTRKKDYQAIGSLTTSTLAEAIRVAEQHGEEEVFIGGGSIIFAQALPVADRIYLTQIHAEVEADVYFPSWNSKEWKVTHLEDNAQLENESPAYSFLILEKVRDDESV